MNLFSNISKIWNKTKGARLRKFWKRLVWCLSVIIVFCTTYLLILPALTLDSNAAALCGKEEHKHTDACYETHEGPVFQCVDSIHKHTRDCYDTKGNCICGYADYVIHTHNSGCYDENNNLICPLPEVSARRGNESSSFNRDFINAAEYHVHTEKCYDEEGNLICTKAEVKEALVHKHSATCFNTDGTLNCKQVEVNKHQHDNCKTIKEIKTLICGKEEHEHDMACYAQEQTTKTKYYCGYDYEHTHGEDCYDESTCTLREHTHTPECLLPRPEIGEITADNGIQLTVSALQDSLPYPLAEVSVSAGLTYDSEAEALLNDYFQTKGISVSDIILMDIALEHEGENIEPTGPVTVSFHVGELMDVAAVYHVDTENGVVEKMQASFDSDTRIVTMVTDHFSTFALAAAGNDAPTATVTAEYDIENHAFSLVQIVATPKGDKHCLRLETYNGKGWTGPDYKAADNGKTLTVNITDIVNSDSMTLNTRFRVSAAEYDNKEGGFKEKGSSDSFGLMELLTDISSGFEKWYNNDYFKYFAGKTPKTKEELFNIFDRYLTLPTMEITESTGEGGASILTAVTDYEGGTYKWEYYDKTAKQWKTLTGATGSVLDTANYSELNGGKEMRCSLYDGESLLCVCEIPWVNPQRAEYDSIIELINTGITVKDVQGNIVKDDSGNTCHLNNYPVAVGGLTKDKGDTFKTIYPDLSIHNSAYYKKQFETVTDYAPNSYYYFYWDAVAKDSRVPFNNGDEYADYLVDIYKSYNDPTEGLAAVKEHWDYYLFDIYDPSNDGSFIKIEGQGTRIYPGKTYGDSAPEFVKDDNSSSFHSTNAADPHIEPLEYGYLDSGIDYTNFFSKLSKTASAVAAGDSNTEREYHIDITANAQAKATAPVAMVLQIQTSWQMFDELHATYDVGVGGSKVGSAAHNTELATLYDIKRALLEFVEYMEVEYPGNCLVLGITETRHDVSQTMFLHPAGSTENNMYVTNDTSLLKDSIINWDIFGNCEHVHYDSIQLQKAIENLPNNLSGWVDKDNNPISYDSIKKVAVIIGGPTENKAGTDGYACVLPWTANQQGDNKAGDNKAGDNKAGDNKGLTFDSFVKDASGNYVLDKNGNKIPVLNSVYGIRTNEGYPINGAPVISWIDYAGNNSGETFHDGVGTRFTKKYVATNEDAILNALKNIAEIEMLQNGMDLTAQDAYVEDVVLEDTVSDEFQVNMEEPFIATIYNSDEYGDEADRGKKMMETVINPETGKVTFTTYTYDNAGEHKTTQNIQGDWDEEYDEDGLRTVTIEFTEHQPYKYMVVDPPAHEGDDPTSHTETGYIDVPQKLVITEKADKTTDVSYTYEKVFNTKKCNLNFGVVAREDFLGSNNVYTNETAPVMKFTHYELDEAGNPTGKVEKHQRVSADTPQVNVPVRYQTEDGGLKRVILNTTVDLGLDMTLNSDIITENVEYLATLYDQINGTLNYTWTLPDGTTFDCGTVTLMNGNLLGGIFPSRDYDYLADSVGLKTCTLTVTFDPTDADSTSENFKQDGITPVGVEMKNPNGHVFIEPFAVDSKTDLNVKKEWEETPPNDLTSITFRVKGKAENDSGQTISEEYLAKESGNWTFTNDRSKAETFTLTKASGWKTTIKDLQAVKVQQDGSYLIYHYVTEEEVPSGYEATYSDDVDVKEEIEYGAKLSFQFSVDEDINNALSVQYTYNGKSNSFIVPKAEYKKENSPFTIEVPRTSGSVEINPSNGQPYEFVVVSLSALSDQGNVDNGKTGKIHKGATSAVVGQIGIKTEATPVSVIRNELASTEVTVRKKLQGFTSSRQFQFKATATEGTIVKPRSGDGYTLNDDGTASFSLAGGESATLRVVYNSTVSIQELDSAGYYVVAKQKGKNDNDITLGSDVALVSIDDQPLTIEFTNTKGERLPSTGGFGSRGLKAFGGALLVTVVYAYGTLLLIKRMKEKHYQSAN